MKKVPRLIEKFAPENYTLSLNIDRTNRSFSGLVSIIGDTKSNDNIEFHHKDLSINSIIIDGKNVDYSISDETIQININQLNAGRHIVTISYTGKIDDDMHGMYPCYYEHDGVKKELIATQFESHYAREVLPCIDEPEAKATFDVTLTTEKNVTVLGNMPIKFQREENGQLITSFETTPRMSSYLLAWVIGELHNKSAKTKDGIDVNIWATPAQKPESLDFALDIAVRTIEFFNDYFKTPYPLTKCDHVALPDFSSGAMENWGLITYREIALLVDPDNTSISSKRYVAMVIAHELSHQWFGNLVTMEWWNNLWLNESFASLVEYTAIDHLEPEWKVWQDFASSDSVTALKRDRLDGVQSVQTDVQSPEEISTLFDGAIVYAKGARLLQMLESYIGEENFRTGLSYYFKEFAYKNTIDQDLWRVLGKTCGIDIGSFMQPWLSQPGFPVLHVKKEGNIIHLSQNKLQSPNTTKSSSIWPILLNCNHENAPKLLDTQSAEFEISSQEPIRFNVDGKTHYIAHYDDKLLSEIIDLIKQGKLSVIDRLQLLNEQSILASMGVISSASLVYLLEAYAEETEDAVWDIISMVIAELKKFANIDEEIEAKLKSFTKNLASKQYTRLGWETKANEPETDTKLRSLILGLMAYSDDSEVIKEATDRFDIKNISNIDSELRSLIISVSVRESSNEELISELLNIYKTTNSSELKQDINAGIASVKKDEQVIRLLETLTDTSTIRIQDTPRWIAYLLRNKYAQSRTWQWIRDNWNWLENTFGGDRSYDSFPRYAASCLSTEQHLNEFKDFFLPQRDNPTLTRTIDIGINEISDRIDLIKRDKHAVEEALNNF